MYVLDASVYVASTTEGDEFHELSRGWIESRLREDEPLVAPNLLAVEVVAVLRRISGSRIKAERAGAALQMDDFVQLLPLSSERAGFAVSVAARTGVRGADAIYLALAEELSAPLVTLDRELLERGARVAAVRRPWAD